MLRNRTIPCVIFLFVLPTSGGAQPVGQGRSFDYRREERAANPPDAKGVRRTIAVADMIEVTRVAGDSHYEYGAPHSPFVFFSPDEKRFVIVLRKGNLTHNTNDYSMLLFDTAEAFDSPVGDPVVEMSSTSNRDGIQRVRWLDEETITFIGETPNDIPQVYELNLRTRHLEQLTAHATPVVDYRIDGRDGKVFFLAEDEYQQDRRPGYLREGIPVTDQTLTDCVAGVILNRPRGKDTYSVQRGGPEVKLPQKEWAPVKERSRAEEATQVLREQDLTTAEKLYVSDPKTGQKALLLDLNPQFARLNFAAAEVIHWKVKDGQGAHGALYLPPAYIPGKKYPLVIQTHFFNTDHFLIDGPWGSGYALQALVAQGFVVVQVGELLPEEVFDKLANTPEEAPYATATYEGLIDNLEARGLIQRDRVGIFGFSRTVYYVAYTLTHSTYHFAAAILEDGIDGGYFQYLSFPKMDNGYDRLYRGGPFGAARSTWEKNSPGFNLDRVRSPVRIMEHGYAGAVQQWEWFSGLKLLHKPVDLVVLPNAGLGEHLLKKPAEQYASQQGTVDWFRYWLKEEEDPDPTKEAQYERWRQLRKEAALSRGRVLGAPVER